MSHALELMKAAGIGVIYQSSSSKLPTSCSHGSSASLHKLHGSTFFWEAIFATPTIVLAGTIHTLAWKIRVEKCHLSFWYGILPGSFRFQTWCGDFQCRGCISTRTLSSSVVCGVLAIFRNRKWLLWDLPISVRKSTKIALWVLSSSKKQDAGMLTGTAECILCDNVTCFGFFSSCSKRSHLPEFFIKAPHFLLAWLLWRQGHFVWCVAFLQCSEIESDCFEIFQSQFGNPRRSPFEFLSGTAFWSKKQDAGMLAGNAKRIFCDNVTCFGTNESCWNRSPACPRHCYGPRLFFLEGAHDWATVFMLCISHCLVLKQVLKEKMRQTIGTYSTKTYSKLYTFDIRTGNTEDGWKKYGINDNPSFDLEHRVTRLWPRFLKNVRIKKISFDIIMGPACLRHCYGPRLLFLEGAHDWATVFALCISHCLVLKQVLKEKMRQTIGTYSTKTYSKLYTFDIRTGNTEDGWKKYGINRQPFFWFGTPSNKIMTKIPKECADQKDIVWHYVKRYVRKNVKISKESHKDMSEKSVWKSVKRYVRKKDVRRYASRYVRKNVKDTSEIMPEDASERVTKVSQKECHKIYVRKNDARRYIKKNVKKISQSKIQVNTDFALCQEHKSPGPVPRTRCTWDNYLCGKQIFLEHKASQSHNVMPFYRGN